MEQFQPNTDRFVRLYCYFGSDTLPFNDQLYHVKTRERLLMFTC